MGQQFGCSCDAKQDTDDTEISLMQPLPKGENAGYRKDYSMASPNESQIIPSAEVASCQITPEKQSAAAPDERPVY